MKRTQSSCAGMCFGVENDCEGAKMWPETKEAVESCQKGCRSTYSSRSRKRGMKTFGNIVGMVAGCGDVFWVDIRTLDDVRACEVSKMRSRG